VITLDVRGLEEVQRSLRNLAQDQMPYAMMLALNDTAFAVLNKSKAQLQSVFDRPTSLITGATRVEKATKETLTAVVSIDPKRAGVLKTHEEGGGRGLQGLEKVLRSANLLPSGYRLVPAKGLVLNAYGNPPAEIVKAVKSWLASGAYRVSRNRRYFVIPIGSPSHLSPGIYLEASGSSGKGAGSYRMRQHRGLFMIVREGTYEKRLKWGDTVRSEAERLLPDEMAKAVQRAIDTAR